MGVFKPEAVMRNMLPVIMAGILGIYGLIASIIMVYSSSVCTRPSPVVFPVTNGITHYTSYAGYGHLAAGLSCGLSCLAAGMSIGIAGDAGRVLARRVRHRRARLRSAGEDFRGYDSDADFRRGSCSVRSDCVYRHRHRYGLPVLSFVVCLF